MQELSLGIKEEILLAVQGLDLYNLYQVSRELKSICSSSVFWKRKFAREGLYILEKAGSFEQWMDIYLYSRKAKEKVRVNLEKKDPLLQLDLYYVPSSSVITVGCVNKDVVEEYLEESRSNEGIEEYLFRIRELQDMEELDEEEEDELSILEFKLESYNYYSLQVVHAQQEIMYYLCAVDGHREETLREDVYFLSPQELEFLLYKVHYYVL
ncbi:hypothetical protein [Cedratvirus kamchatka]|uniref:F-box domain-containing protein n=1 Tax=Cedratvirus kamchatka TaxID=2716914 RepID=A0A6G8MX41_9VIRU|nr:hypothetical protein [Cedratvirus kamchatka]